MTTDLLKDFLTGLPAQFARMSGVPVEEATGDPSSNVISEFLRIFAGVNLGQVLNDLGGTMLNLLQEQSIQYFLGLEGIEMSEPTIPYVPRRPIGAIIKGVPPEALSDESGTTEETEEIPTYQEPEEVLEQQQRDKEPEITRTAKTRSRLMESKSATVIDETAVLDTLNEVTNTHSQIVIGISVISVIAELASAGQMDEILESLQSCYTLLDTSAEFHAAQTARVDISFERPLRYYLESKHMNNVPPPADLGRMLAREVIDPEVYSANMAYYGFPEYWADKYKRARFIELPAEIIFKALHYNIITPEEVPPLLRIADYNPAQVPLLTELSYDYPNRTELRLMVRRSSIPEPLVARALATSGLRPEYQPFLVETLENWAVDSIRTSGITESLGQFERGFIQEERLVELVTENDASKTEAEHYLRLAILRRDGRRKQDRTKTLRTGFRHGLLQPDESYRNEFEKHMPDLEFEQATEADVYRVLMSDLGYDAVDIEIMLDDDRIRSKNIEVIEGFDELLSLLGSDE